MTEFYLGWRLRIETITLTTVNIPRDLTQVHSRKSKSGLLLTGTFHVKSLLPHLSSHGLSTLRPTLHLLHLVSRANPRWRRHVSCIPSGGRPRLGRPSLFYPDYTLKFRSFQSWITDTSTLSTASPYNISPKVRTLSSRGLTTKDGDRKDVRMGGLSCPLIHSQRQVLRKVNDESRFRPDVEGSL